MNEYEALAYEIGVRQNINNITEEGWNVVVGALQKQVPKKPIDKLFLGAMMPHCPACEDLVSEIIRSPYCRNCGQAIDWREE